MKEVIEEILLTEKQARDKVTEARDKAKSMRLEAEKKAQTILTDAKEKAKEETAERIKQAEAQAEKQKSEALETSSAGYDALLKSKEQMINDTLDAMFQLVLGKAD